MSNLKLTKEHIKYLEDLRDSGAMNMWGAGTALEEAFNLEEADASDILIEWIKSFKEQGN